MTQVLIIGIISISLVPLSSISYTKMQLLNLGQEPEGVKLEVVYWTHDVKHSGSNHGTGDFVMVHVYIYICIAFE